MGNPPVPPSNTSKDTAVDDLTLIRQALDALPQVCRYHGDKTEPHGSNLHGRTACCDTGVPAQRRKLAEQALRRVEQLAAGIGHQG